HDPCDVDDKLVRDCVLKEITHRINEHHARGRPSERFGELLRNQPQIKPLLIGMSGNTAKAFGKGFCIAMLTSEGAWRRVARARAQVPRSAARCVPVCGWSAQSPAAGRPPARSLRGRDRRY